MLEYGRIKRSMDILLAIFLVALVAPIILFLSGYIFLRLRANPFFRQQRIGFKLKPFTILKFRTMPVCFREETGFESLPKDFQMIRNLGLDELPQIFLILKGEMSWIGPRPLLPEYLPLYSKKQLKRHNCLPGIIGLAQVKGGNLLSWETRFRYDILYVKKQSFLLDVKILFLYLIKFGRRKDSSVFSEPFQGKP